MSSDSTRPPGLIMAAGTRVAVPDANSVGRLAGHGAVWTFLLILVRYGLNLLSTAILARLLSVNDYGLIGMMSVLVELLQLFSDIGVSWATVQRPDLTYGQVDDLFWFNTGAGGLLSAICAAAGPCLASFFRQPELSDVAWVMGIGFLIGGLAVQPAALLKRQMQFRAITVIETVVACSGVVVAVTMAALSFGYWALVWQSIATQLVRTVLMFYASGYRPRLPRTGRGTLPLLGFGGWVIVMRLTTYVARSVDKTLLGRRWGAVELGYYSRAFALMSLPTGLATNAVGEVIGPALAAIQSDTERLGALYRKGLITVALVAAPVAGGLVTAAPEIIRLLYGPKWLPVVPILAWLSVESLFDPIFSSSSWLFMATGKVRLGSYVLSIRAALLTLGYAVSIRWGAVGVAVAHAFVTSVCIALPVLWVAHRAAGLLLRKSLEALSGILGITALMMAATFLTGSFLGAHGTGWQLVLAAKIGLGVVVYLLGISWAVRSSETLEIGWKQLMSRLL